MDNLDACPGNLLASFLRQRQQNPKRFRAGWQMKCKAAIRPSKGTADRNLRLVHRSPPSDWRWASVIRTAGWRKFMQRRDVTRIRRIFGNGRIRGETATERHQTESRGPVFPSRSAPLALFFSKLAPYIEGAGSPAMEINDRRNKPFGPGGSTRRLHPSPP